MSKYPFPTLTPRIPLHDALWRIADKFKLSHEQLLQYAAEDEIGGYHHDKKERTRDKGIWGVEGQVVYALIRATKPKHVLEIGNCWGTSTLHIAEAVLQNGEGKVTTLDIQGREDGRPVTRIPRKYKPIVTSVKGDLREFNYRTRPLLDFVFEDSYHTVELVSHVWREFRDHARKGAYIVSHDSEHFRVGEPVRAGIAAAGYAPDEYLSVAIDPADCGLVIGRKD